MSDTPDNRQVTIVGAGLAGALMAARLGQFGFEVRLYEARSDPRGRELAGGRSINLAISTRGLEALAQVGLADDILRIALPMSGRMIHSPGGALTFQPYGVREQDVLNSVSRGGLNLMLIEAAARHSNVRLCFDHKCTGIDLTDGGVLFKESGAERPQSAKHGFVIGADGAFSAVRRSMQRLDRFNFSQSYLDHGYKELAIPPGPNGGHRMANNALHIWPRRSFMMIALPNVDGSFTCTLFFPFEGPRSFASLRTDDDVRLFFESEFPDALALMPTLVEDFNANPTSSLVTVRCSPWHWQDRAVLLGDACHAVVPFYGQGANAAFEDCTVLGDLLADQGSDVETAFKRYYQARKCHVDTLADLALHNFIEMRDRTGSRLFLMKKKLEKGLHQAFPTWFVPLYSMVTFSRMGYLDAVLRARRQWAVVAAVGAGLAVLAALALLLALLG